MDKNVLLFTRANGTAIFINPDKVLFVQPLRSAEYPNTASQIFFSASDFVSLRDSFDEVIAKFDEVIAKIDPIPSLQWSGEIGS
jgi:hypothetical protein